MVLTTFETLYAAEYWRRYDATHFVAEFMDDYPVIVSEASLAYEHSLLPVAMDEMLRRQHTGLFKKAGLQGNYVYCTLAVLNHNILSLPDINGDENLLANITDLIDHKEIPALVELHGVVVWTQHFQHGHLRVPLVVHTETTTLRTFKSTLDERYPMWESRWLMGCELGINKWELARHAFSTEKISRLPAVLPDTDLV